MIYMLDRSALVHLMSVPDSAMRDRMRVAKEAGHRLTMSALTLAELEGIAVRLGDNPELRRVLDQLQEVVDVLDWPAAAAAVLGRMPSSAETPGTSRQVAAHAIAASAVLVYASPALPPAVSGLPAEDWTRRDAPANPG